MCPILRWTVTRAERAVGRFVLLFELVADRLALSLCLFLGKDDSRVFESRKIASLGGHVSEFLVSRGFYPSDLVIVHMTKIAQSATTDSRDPTGWLGAKIPQEAWSSRHSEPHEVGDRPGAGTPLGCAGVEGYFCAVGLRSSSILIGWVSLLEGRRSTSLSSSSDSAVAFLMCSWTESSSSNSSRPRTGRGSNFRQAGSEESALAMRPAARVARPHSTERQREPAHLHHSQSTSMFERL